MNYLALKMIYGQPRRALAMIFGMSFAAFLMAQQTAIFWGVMTWTYAPMRVVRAPLWIAAPQVEQINDYDPLRMIDVQRVRSVPGVSWAVPAFSSYTYARLPDGRHRPIQLMGVDETTLTGAPVAEVAGGAQSLRRPDAVWMDDYGLEFLKPRGGQALRIGDVLEINERRAVIAGVFPARRAFSGAPFVLTTFPRAVHYSLPQRRLVSFILAKPQPGRDPATIARAIEAQTRLRAFTDAELVDSTLEWWLRNTGVPGSFLTTVVVSVLFGFTVTGLTFSSFTAQHTQHYAALRAMGTGPRTLVTMLAAQSLSLAALSFVAGIGAAGVFGMAVAERGLPPFRLTWQIAAGVFGAQLLAGLLGPALTFRKIHRIDPAVVFRA